jgi:hypothetical protein
LPFASHPLDYSLTIQGGAGTGLTLAGFTSSKQKKWRTEDDQINWIIPHA